MDDKQKLSQQSLKKNLRNKIIMLAIFYILISALIIIYLSFQEAKEQQDHLLSEFSSNISQKYLSISSRNISLEQVNDDDVIITYNLNSPPPTELKHLNTLHDGFHTLIFFEKEWRVFIHHDKTDPGLYFFVAQMTEARNEYARNSFLSFAIPTLTLMILLLFMVNYTLNKYFEPLEKMGEQVIRRSPTDLSPLPDKNVFLELLPFFNSINSLLERSRQHINSQNMFFANAAHELRTPIAAISLQVENLLNATKEEQLERQVFIKSALSRLRNMVNQILDLARIERESNEKWNKSSFLSIITKVTEELFPLIEEKNINMEVEQSNDLLIYNCNQEVDCLIKNAMENAIKFSQPDSEIKVSLQEDQGNAVFKVENFGVEISESHLKKIEEPFFKIHQSIEGSGLGLSICHKIAKNMGGTLKIENTSYKSFLFIYQQPLAFGDE